MFDRLVKKNEKERIFHALFLFGVLKSTVFFSSVVQSTVANEAHVTRGPKTNTSAPAVRTKKPVNFIPRNE